MSDRITGSFERFSLVTMSNIDHISGPPPDRPGRHTG
jgi:hypothetical protein